MQEAGDEQRWMGKFAYERVLNWKGGLKKTVPFSSVTNTPIFWMAPSSCIYCAFASIFKVLEAPHFCRETVLQYPGQSHMEDANKMVTDEIVGEEKVNFQKDISVDEGVASDKKMVKQ